MRRKIAIVTGTRAEYGLLYWIIKDLHEDENVELQLIVTGMHLSPEFGLTVKEIEKDGFPIADKVEMLISSDTETAIATSMGLGMIGFAKAYERLLPDILLVLGDRFEILSAVATSVPFRIPVAHISGGESTEGAIDEPIRHAVTKMSHIHFASTERYRKRIIQMGEQPDRVFCLGAPSIDNINKLKFFNKDDLYRELDIPSDKKVGVVTYHPVTLENNTSESQILLLIEVLREFTDIYWVFTMPNADTYGRAIAEKVKHFTQEYAERSKLVFSLGSLRYLSLLKNAQLMIGNSSSGLIEAPSFELPVVNMGDRQKGRVRTDNVIDVPVLKAETIRNAINKAISTKFRDSLKGLKNPYGAGGASEQIVEKLKTIPLGELLLKKRFHDLPN